jgi:hypothetical protein
MDKRLEAAKMFCDDFLERNWQELRQTLMFTAIAEKDHDKFLEYLRDYMPPCWLAGMQCDVPLDFKTLFGSAVYNFERGKL